MTISTLPPAAETSRRAGYPPAPPGDAERVSRRLVLTFAIACGIAVATNYYAQPLLDRIAREFDVGAATAGLIVTASQLGYAAGLVLLVPLGDVLERRRLVVTVLTVTAAALVAAAAAPSIGVLLAAAACFGSTSVVAQILVPFAASLAGDEERGRVVGTVMSGLLTGVLLARTVAGLVAEVAGWRAVYVLAALSMLGLSLALHHVLPVSPPAERLGYGSLLRSVGRLVREEPVLRLRAAYGALTFAAFSVLWTSLAFLLARPPYGYGDAVIGLFGLLGAAGALAASVAGRAADRGHAARATGAWVTASLVGFGVLTQGGDHLAAVVVGVLLVDLGVQGTHITNQSLIYRLRPEARSRLTTAYMTTYFAGGALGSAGSAWAYARSGWSAVCLLGLLCTGAALALWLLTTAVARRPRRAVL